MKISLAIALLLSNSNSVLGINTKTTSNLIEQSSTEQSSQQTIESGRYRNTKGESIDPFQKGYLKISLSKEPRWKADVQDMNLLQVDACNKGDGEGDCKTVKSGDSSKVHIPQKNLDDNVYIGEFTVGTPPQKVRAVFDTGSTNTWILNKNTDIGGKEKELSYDNDASSTAQKTKQKAIISFGSGKLGGHFYTDNVQLGSCTGDDKGLVQITSQKFGNVEKQKTIFTGDNFEGIVGMGYDTLAEKNVKPMFDTMMEQKLLKENIFAFSFASGNKDSSDLTLGYYDKSKMKGDIHWNPVEYKYMYGVKMDDIKVNGKSTNVCKEKSCLITFDSGTSLMSMPSYAEKVFNDAGLPTMENPVKCKGASDFNDLTFVIGGKDYTLHSNEWMMPSQSSFAQTEFNPHTFGPIGPELTGEDGQELIQHNQMGMSLVQSKSMQGTGESVCRSKMQKMDISRDQFLVGAVFMRKFYTIFDRDQDRVGLALASGASDEASSSLSELSQVTSLSQGKKSNQENRKDLKQALKKLNW